MIEYILNLCPSRWRKPGNRFAHSRQFFQDTVPHGYAASRTTSSCRARRKFKTFSCLFSG